MNLRLTTSATVTVVLASIVLLFVSAGTAGLTWDTVSQRPPVVEVPRGGCDAQIDLAAVVGGRVQLFGPVDARAIDRVRRAAQSVWWALDLDDRLVPVDCGACEREAVAVAAAFVPEFETGRSGLARDTVLPLEEFMRACPRARIEIAGYADSRWARTSDPARLHRDYGMLYNERLSAARAETVRSLLAASVAGHRILSARGEGFTPKFASPGLHERSPEALRPNRTARVSFSFVQTVSVPQRLRAPLDSGTMFWVHWALASIAGVALGFALAACVSWVRGISDAELVDTENRLAVIEGIGPHFAERIESATGIRSIAQLANATSAQLEAIAALRTHEAFPPVGRPKADGWAAMARLILLPMVTKDWAEVLVAAGVTDPQALAAMRPADLRAALAAANIVDTKARQQHLAPWLPSVVELDYLIRVARDEVVARRLRQRAGRRVSVARLIRALVKLASKAQGRTVVAEA